MGWHLLDIYRRLIGVQIRSQLQYRTSFFFDVLATAAITLTEFSAIALAMNEFQTIGGWQLGEVALLYGLVEAAFGVMDTLFSGFDPQNFGQQVRLGRFDQILLRPINVTVQVLGSRFVIRRLGRIVFGFVIFGYGAGAAGVVWTVGKVLYLPLVFAGIVLFFGGLFIVGATITFWTIESIEVINVLTYGGSMMISYPMHIYTTWFRRFFTYIVPAIFLNYTPALYFLDKPDPLGFPNITRFFSPLVGLYVLLLSLAFWRFGRRHYQSTGT